MAGRTLAVLACLFVTPAAHAQDWPARPLTMVVAFPARGSDDILARILAPRLADRLGQKVTVENMSGGGGVAGSLRVAKAAPDGYEFMLGTSATHALSQVVHQPPPYDSRADFVPVALVAEQPFILIARTDLPQRLPDFIAQAKAKGTTMRYGSAGTGSATHLVCALLSSAAGIEAQHMPFNGGAPALEALIAGRIDYFCPVVTIAIAPVQAGTIRAVAMLSRERSSVLPAVASAHEQGLADFTASTWFAIFLPKGAPAAVVAKLHEATLAAMADREVQEQLAQIGAQLVAPERRSPAYLGEFLPREIAKWSTALRAGAVKP